MLHPPRFPYGRWSIMKIINDLTSIAYQPVSTIALGTFDGVHVGHQRIIGRAVELARQMDGQSLVFTSSNHPLSAIAPQKCPRLITPLPAKTELIRSLGVDFLALISFNQNFLALSPNDFVDMLCRLFEPRHIVVGPNYTFGHKAAGTVETLRCLSQRYGFSVEVPEAVHHGGIMVSSTAIRSLIAAGDVAKAAHMLTRPVCINGYLCHFEKNRHKPNYAKAVVEVDNSLAVPADGIYYIHISTGEERHGGLAKVSRTSETVGYTMKLELYMFSATKFITPGYGGRSIEIEFTNPAQDGYVVAKQLI